MGVSTISGHCHHCQAQVMAQKQGPNHILHLLLSVVTGGLWLIVWLFVGLSSSSAAYRCTRCGSPISVFANLAPPAQRTGKWRVGTLVLLGAIVLGLFLVQSAIDPRPKDNYAGNADTRREIAKARPVMSERFVALRDEGIRNIGWVAGNVEGHPIWPQVRPFVDKDGSYYNSFMRLSSGRMDDLAEASANIALYRKARERGQAAAFNEAEATSRIKRVVAIIEELTAEMRAVKSSK